MRAETLRLDRLIRAGAIHSMTGETYRSVGLRGPEIVAVSTEPDGLDDLAGAGTIVTDAPDLTLLPARPIWTGSPTSPPPSRSWVVAPSTIPRGAWSDETGRAGGGPGGRRL